MINKFPNKLVLEDIGAINGTQIFKVVEDFKFISDKFGELVCPSGFLTDGVSTPRILWALIGPTSRAFKIAVIHDYLFSINCKYKLTRSEADSVMLEGCKYLGLPWWECQSIHKALMLFSWTCWKKKSQ